MEEGDVFRTFVPLKVDKHGNSRYKLTERQQIILDIIRQDSKTQYDDIALKVGVSAATVKREIQEIKKQIMLSYDKRTSEWVIK